MTLRTIALLLLCLLLLGGCADQHGTAMITTGDSGGTAGDAADIPEDQGEPEPEPAPVPEPEPAPEDFFETIAHDYMFCSGAGGWSTGLTVADDGSFTGAYHDSDMGVTGENFPGGTLYYCSFSGKLARPVKAGDCTYSTRLESLELDHPAGGAEEYAGGIRYVYSGPYGLENAEELLIYLPGARADSLPEAALWWLRGPYDWQPTEEGTLGVHLIYNVSEELGFAQYPVG